MPSQITEKDTPGTQRSFLHTYIHTHSCIQASYSSNSKISTADYWNITFDSPLTTLSALGCSFSVYFTQLATKIDDINTIIDLRTVTWHSSFLQMDAASALPNELWISILKLVNKKDLKVLRLTGEPHLQTPASSLLFTTAFVAARRSVLNAFISLTTHPFLCVHVKEVVFDSSWIDPETPSVYADEKCGPPLFEFYQEQETIQCHELRPRFDQAFHCLKNLKRVCYADLSRISCLPGDYANPLWGYQYSDSPNLRRLESGLYSRDMGICCLEPGKLQGCSDHEENGRFRRQFGGFAILMEVLAKYATGKLKELSIGRGDFAAPDKVQALGTSDEAADYGPLNGGIPNWFFSSQDTGDTLRYLPSVFRGLCKLDLTVCFVHMPRIPTKQCPSPNAEHRKQLGDVSYLAALLSSADNLEELKLAGEYDTAHLRLEDTLATNTWPKLRRLELKRFDANAHELRACLERHEKCLEHVKLDHFNITSGSWADAMELDHFNITSGSWADAMIPPPGSSFHANVVIGLAWSNGVSINVESLPPWKDQNIGHPYIDSSSCSLDDDDSSDNLSYSSDDSGSDSDIVPRRKT